MTKLALVPTNESRALNSCFEVSRTISFNGETRDWVRVNLLPTVNEKWVISRDFWTIAANFHVVDYLTVRIGITPTVRANFISDHFLHAIRVFSLKRLEKSRVFDLRVWVFDIFNIIFATSDDFGVWITTVWNKVFIEIKVIYYLNKHLYQFAPNQDRIRNSSRCLETSSLYNRGKSWHLILH